MKRYYALCLSVLLLLLAAFPAGTAKAHVVDRSDDGSLTAVIHVTPGDDPVAGEPSSIYIDVTGAATAADLPARLTVTGPAGSDGQDMPFAGKGAYAGTYLFASRASYRLDIDVPLADSGTGRISYTVRVSRGSGTSMVPPVPAWAEPLILTSVIGIALTIIVMFNRRKRIAEYTRSHK